MLARRKALLPRATQVDVLFGMGVMDDKFAVPDFLRCRPKTSEADVKHTDQCFRRPDELKVKRCPSSQSIIQVHWLLTLALTWNTLGHILNTDDHLEDANIHAYDPSCVLKTLLYSTRRG